MINVNPEYFMENVSVGDVINYSAIGYYSDNSTLDITEAVLWLSSDVRIVTVDDSGIAVALKYGKANIYALHGGIYSNIQKINIKNSN
ncbi:Ig-like domain-containing protein [Aeromonas sp.]|uniref:Ig-like domain-containing protein n=1 Tax=Aeromonas sp. TaxID=647 RepID=UPI0025844A62|nr:Ig-like domain-containing protein [Aeromonas sp.]MCX7132122.1 Ig-like domain-containing protein [Aeromonas sp.]